MNVFDIVDIDWRSNAEKMNQMNQILANLKDVHDPIFYNLFRNYIYWRYC